MNTKFIQVIFGMTLLLLAPYGMAATENNSSQSVQTSTETVQSTKPTAKIINVKPRLVVKSVPEKVCRQVPRTVYYQGRGSSGAGALVGGVAGGLVGSQIGGGTGNVIATIGGAALGAAAGNQIERTSQRGYAQTVYVTVCKNRYIKKSVPNGYEVTYIYNGKQGTTIMKKKPIGDTISLKLIPAI